MEAKLVAGVHIAAKPKQKTVAQRCSMQSSMMSVLGCQGAREGIANGRICIFARLKLALGVLQSSNSR